MIVFSIVEIVGGQPDESAFAEYHISAFGNGYKWELVSPSPVKDGRLFFKNRGKTRAGDRLFLARLDDPQNELPSIVVPELLVPNKESGLCLQSQKANSNKTRFEFFRKKYDKKTNTVDTLFQVYLVDELMMDSCLVLQLLFPKNDPITLRFPIFVQPDDAVEKRYHFMQNELEAEGLYSFIYDELHGVFSTRRISLEWKEGSTALSQEDSWVEREAIHKIWKWMFSKAIPAILHAPAYNVSNTIDLEQISRVHRLLPSMIRKPLAMLSDNSFVIAKVRRQDFAIHAHVVIVSFLKRINLRLATICDELTAKIYDAQKREAAEKNKKFGVGARGALRSIEGEIEDLIRIVSEERAKIKRMKDDLRRLESTQVFKESFSLPVRSVFDVAPACFSFNNIYQAIRKRIIDFDSQHYNWYARANSTLLRARPIDSTQDPMESVYQWKYSKVYQYWCYYHFVRAAVSIGLKMERPEHFNSRDGSWIAFKTNDSSAPVRLSLFHEVKGCSQHSLWTRATKSPLQADEWCVGDRHNDDAQLSSDNQWKYLTPDFVLEIEGASKRPFLIVLDAKSYPWGQDHADAQKKYRSFCQYLKGYQYIKGSVLDPTSRVQTLQSWIICPNKYSQNQHNPCLSLTGSSWSIQSGRLSFSGQWNPGYLLDTSNVGLGCLAGDPSIGVGNVSGENFPPIDYKKPFEDFLRLQIEYYRNDYPAALTK